MSGAVTAQITMELDLRDGSVVTAQAVAVVDQDFEALVDGRRQRIARRDLLAIRGVPALATELMSAALAGGDVVHGALVGGDSAGDELELLSPVLGRVVIAVDRLAALVNPGVHPGDIRMPEGVEEAVFLPTAGGFDLVAGTLHRFGPEGVQFQALAAEAPQWFKLRSFSAVRLAGATIRKTEAPARLLTRTADRLGVGLRRADAAGLELELERGPAVLLRWPDLACLVFDRDVVHLSDLTPSVVEESGFDGDVVYPWQRDRCACGGELVAMGRSFGRGLGVHSKSRLSFVVPEGALHFRTRVALDDTAAELPLLPQADVRVLRAGKLVFEVAALAPGATPRDTGLIPVEAGQTLTLEVDFGAGRDLGDRVDWLLPMFLMRSSP